MRRFSLEHEYRLRYTRDQFDLASSSPQPLTARDVLAVAGLDHSHLLDTPLDYERGGGDRDLRNAVAALYDGITGDDVLITAGASEGIRVALTAAIHPGDRVVVQQPAYAALYNTSFALGADVLPWRSDGGFQFDFASLSDESRTATAIIFNNPHGPSGSAVLGD